MRKGTVSLGLGVMAGVLLPATGASADDDAPPGGTVTDSVTQYTEGGIVYTEASSVLVVPSNSSPDGRRLSPNIFGSGGGFTAEARLVNAGDGSNFWLSYARTAKISGSGSYTTDVHSNLSEYSSQSQWFADASNANWVWGYKQASCMNDSATNATAQSCSTPHRSAGSNFYWSASGHDFESGSFSWQPTIDIYEQCHSGSCSVVTP